MKITTVAKVANKRFKENSETITLNVDISFEYEFNELVNLKDKGILGKNH